MVSAIDRCKRALVTLLQTLARLYGCRVTVTRDSPDDVVKRACRTVSKKTLLEFYNGHLGLAAGFNTRLALNISTHLDPILPLTRAGFQQNQI